MPKTDYFHKITDQREERFAGANVKFQKVSYKINGTTNVGSSNN